MKTTVKIEEAAITAASLYLLSIYHLDLPVWFWIILFFSPDLSMLGYLINTRFGAMIYNAVHHRASALLIAGVGLITGSDIIISIGILLFAHSSFDRMLGYGLKYPDDFKHTHLGWIGKS